MSAVNVVWEPMEVVWSQEKPPQISSLHAGEFTTVAGYCGGFELDPPGAISPGGFQVLIKY